MDQLTYLDTWKRLLSSLEQADNKKDVKLFSELENLFGHITPQTAPRLQRDYESCTLQSIQIFGQLFESIDLSDKKLLCSFLKALKSFGYFRIAQITYHVEWPREEYEPDPLYFPTVEKAKWYDLCPLLPEAGTIGWKSVLNHGLVKDEVDRQLLQICLQLLLQKLHFYSVILALNRFGEFSSVIKRNGQKVTAKLLELIRDVSYDDGCMIGLDTFLFNLLLPFTEAEQQELIIDAAIQDIFKPLQLQMPYKDDEFAKIYDLINESIMNITYLQDLMVKKLIDHLKINIIRRKRRHSVDSTLENGNLTLETILDEINSGEKLVDFLPKIDQLELSSKSIQSNYISYWIGVVNHVVPQRTLTAGNAIKILSTCSTLLVATSNIISQDLVPHLSLLMANTVENTVQSKLDKLFNSCNLQFLLELTKVLCEKTEILSTFDSPIQRFYKSYLNRYLRSCISKGVKPEVEKFAHFVDVICDKSLDRRTSHLLQYICLHELASCLESFKNKGNNKVLITYLDCAKKCSKRLHKFIKRHTSSKNNELDTSDLNNSTEHLHFEATEEVALDALVCILRIALDRNDQEMLDYYSESLLKLFSSTVSRIEKLVDAIQVGRMSYVASTIDRHLSKILTLYVEHKNSIKNYLNYDLVETVLTLICIDSPNLENDAKNGKKIIYNHLKSKLEALKERANCSTNVFPTIINKQYSSLADCNTVEREEQCCISQEMKILHEVNKILLVDCDSGLRDIVLSKTIHFLEQCDPLDHPRLLYMLIILESLVPIEDADILCRISCGLVRICQSVELGPSIHAFTNASTHKSSRAIQCCTYAKCIKLYTSIFLRCTPKATNLLLTDVMQICVSSNLAKYSSKPDILFKHLASAIVGLLQSIAIGNKDEEILKSYMPTFLAVFSNLIRCLICAASHGNDELESLALGVSRILLNLSSARIRLFEFAPHLIATYVKDIQRASCSDYVRRHLDEGIFRIFNLLDAHQKERQEKLEEEGLQRKTTAGRASGSLFDMIHARLDQSSREIFKDMYENYNRFHRYLGKC